MSIKNTYLSTPAWKELVREDVLGRPTLVWKERPRHVLDLLDVSLAKDDLDFVVQGERRLTFAAFRHAVEAGAAQLQKSGVGRGDKVLIVLYNSPDIMLLQWSSWRLGAVPVFGNRWWSERELAEIVDRNRPRLIVTDMQVSPEAAGGATVVKASELASWWSAPVAGAVADPRQDAREDSVAAIVFTAGSGGPPKGVQLSHRNLVWTQQTLHNMAPKRADAPKTAAEQKVGLMTTPMFHNGAIVTGLTNMLDGHRIVLLGGRFNPEEVLQLIQRERVTAWQAVPTMFNRALQHPNLKNYDLSSLSTSSTGGTMVPAQLLAELKDKIPNAAANFVIGYGMTEASFLTMAVTSHIESRPGTVGKPIPSVDLKINDPDENGEGEVFARSGALMIGYHNMEEQPIDAEGWFHTGDLGRLDADGYLYITGRSKDMVIRGGENIACAHVESALIGHDDIEEVAVTGYPDDDLGEALAAIVYLRPGSEVSDADLTAYAKERLAYFAVPSLWVRRDEPLPVLATGKIDKRTLAREVLDRIARGD